MVEAPMIFVAYSKACYRNRNDVWGEGRGAEGFVPFHRATAVENEQPACSAGRQVSTAFGEGCCKISPHLGCDAEDRCNIGNSATS